MGRPPKPTNLLELTGAFRKNPGRRKAREQEPQPPAIALEMPARFQIFHPDIGYQDAEKLRGYWNRCLAMWPWLTFSDSDALEFYCDLKLKVSKGKADGTEKNLIAKMISEFGGTGAGRAKLGVQAAKLGGQAKASTAPADPRAAFLARRKFG
jgi:hypothetical protein